MAAEQIAPGFYRATLKTPETAGAVIAVSDEAGRPVSQAWTPDYPAEFQVMQDGTPLLKELSAMTGGKFDVKPEDILRPATQAATTRRELAAMASLPPPFCFGRWTFGCGEENGPSSSGNSLSAFSQRPLAFTR